MDELAYRGARKTIVWADDGGRCHGKDYFNRLPDKDRAKIEVLLERMGEHGQIRNVEHFRHEEDGLYCFKRHQRRLMCFFFGDEVVITHGFTKKRDRLDRKELTRGARIREQYVARKGGA